MKLTTRRLEELKCPAGKRDVMVFDDEQRGLGVRVTASGGKSYLCQYSFGHSKRRIPLGSVAAISLASARDAAQAIMGAVAQGRDPAAERKAAAAAGKRDILTLGMLISQWASRHLVHRRGRYAIEATRALHLAFERYLKAPATALSAKTVRAVIRAVADDGRRAMARQTAAYGSACFSWAIHVDLLAENPFSGLRLEPAPSRERVLTDDELRSIWNATNGQGPYSAIVRLLMLTGQRREEVAGMRWGELDADLTTWTIPGTRTKNHRDHIVPLSPHARAVLAAQPQLGDDRVFWSRNFAAAKAALDTQSGVTGWRLHDLRRTVATGLQKLGVRLEVCEAVLNHVSGSRAGIVGVYQRHSWSDEKRAALMAWGERVAAIVEERDPTGNVTPLRARSA
jgi:integrase